MSSQRDDASDIESKRDLMIALSAAPPEQPLESLPERMLSYDEILELEPAFETEDENATVWAIDALAFDNITTTFSDAGGNTIDEEDTVRAFAIQRGHTWIPFTYGSGNEEMMGSATGSDWHRCPRVSTADVEIDLDEELPMGKMDRVRDLLDSNE